MLLLLQTAQRKAEQQNNFGHSFKTCNPIVTVEYQLQICDRRVFKKTFGSPMSEVRKRLRTAYCAHHIAWLWHLNLRNLRVKLGLTIET